MHLMQTKSQLSLCGIKVKFHSHLTYRNRNDLQRRSLFICALHPNSYARLVLSRLSVYWPEVHEMLPHAEFIFRILKLQLSFFGAGLQQNTWRLIWSKMVFAPYVLVSPYLYNVELLYEGQFILYDFLSWIGRFHILPNFLWSLKLSSS